MRKLLINLLVYFAVMYLIIVLFMSIIALLGYLKMNILDILINALTFTAVSISFSMLVIAIIIVSFLFLNSINNK